MKSVSLPPHWLLLRALLRLARFSDAENDLLTTVFQPDIGP